MPVDLRSLARRDYIAPFSPPRAGESALTSASSIAFTTAPRCARMRSACMKGGARHHRLWDMVSIHQRRVDARSSEWLSNYEGPRVRVKYIRRGLRVKWQRKHVERLSRFVRTRQDKRVACFRDLHSGRSSMLLSNFRLFEPFEFSSDIYSAMRRIGFMRLIAKWNVTRGYARKRQFQIPRSVGYIVSVDVTKLLKNLELIFYSKKT